MPPTPDSISAARALSAVPPEPDMSSPSMGPSSPSSDSPDHRPLWGASSPSLTSSRLNSSTRFSRPSTNFSRTHSSRFASRAVPAAARLVRSAEKASRNLLALFNSLSPLQRLVVVVGLVLVNVLIILFIVFSHSIFAWLAPISHKWRALPGGWLIAFALTFACAFPPVIGYNTTLTIAGFVYGFPLGYPIVASATVAGSLAAFVACRTVLSKHVNRLVGQDHRFVALGQVLRKDGLGMLTAVRFCPLPYSISNGFLATIPSVKPWSFAAATALASPKLLVHVFIGSRLALIAEQGDEMSAGDKAVNYVSMFLGALVGVAVGWVIYNRTVARAAELALEEANEHHGHADHLRSHYHDPAYNDDEEDADGDGVAAAAAGGGRRSRRNESRAAGGRRIARGSADFDYADVEAGLVDPEDVAALMEEDDISLWGNDDGIERERYRDEEEEQEGDGNRAGQDGTRRENHTTGGRGGQAG